jgi:hypothetical protein
MISCKSVACNVEAMQQALALIYSLARLWFGVSLMDRMSCLTSSQRNQQAVPMATLVPLTSIRLRLSRGKSIMMEPRIAHSRPRLGLYVAQMVSEGGLRDACHALNHAVQGLLLTSDTLELATHEMELLLGRSAAQRPAKDADRSRLRVLHAMWQSR